MLVDMNFEDKTVLIFGEGDELENRTRQFLDAGATVTVASTQLTRNLRADAKAKRFEFVPCNYGTAWKRLVKKNHPYIVVLATTNREVASEIAKQIRDEHQSLIYAVDMPDFNDFNMPALAKRGDIRVAVSTGGRSPAMARVLRNRIEHVITPEDSREVRLQSMIRQEIKNRIPDAQTRKDCIYTIIENRKIKQFLRTGRFEEAQRLATKQITSFVRRATS